MARCGRYNAVRVKQDGICFGSKLENRRYNELKTLQRVRKIEGLVVHPVFNAVVNGTHVCKIILDFQYFDIATQRLIYEDTKGVLTDISKLKLKILKALFPEVEVKLVYAAGEK